MPAHQDDRSVRILRIVGWTLGIFGLLLLADDFVGDNRHDNAAGVLFIIAGIATLLAARYRESRRRGGQVESPEEPSPGDDGDASENSA